jgi:hypothetical protein
MANRFVQFSGCKVLWGREAEKHSVKPLLDELGTVHPTGRGSAQTGPTAAAARSGPAADRLPPVELVASGRREQEQEQEQRLAVELAAGHLRLAVRLLPGLLL